MRNKRGSVMQPRTVAKLEKIMLDPAHAHCSLKEIAALTGLHNSTVERYQTPEFKAHLAQKRQAALAQADIKQLDKALFERALAGDLGAAKLLYSRWDKHQASLNDMMALDNTELLTALDEIDTST